MPSNTGKKRNRRRFRAVWIGPTCDEGFVINGNFYVGVEIVRTSPHYRFINEYNKLDLAHEKYFKFVKYMEGKNK